MFFKKSFFVGFLISFLLIINIQKSSAQETGKLDAVFIAKEYFNSIVKILLFDSIAEKEVPGSGYLGRGSGFIVTEDGMVFTNRHVIDYCMEYMQYKYFSPSDKKYYTEINNFNSSCLTDPEYLNINYVRRATPIIQVYTDKNQNNYKLYIAKLISLDTENFDGAVLQIVSDMKGNPVNEKFHPLPIGNSDMTNQGEDLCLFGFPAQYDDANFELMLRDQSTLTFGKHSGFDFVFNPEYGYIKTDASVNSGNSGGPVFNPSNKIIGIATATGEKTNIGLIGGINAMYNIVDIPNKYLELYQKIDILKAGMGIYPDKLSLGRNCKLLDDLHNLGLTAPAKTPAKNTAILFTQQRIPTHDEIQKSNKIKKFGRKFKGDKDYFKFSFSLLESNKFLIEGTRDTVEWGIILNNPDKVLKVEEKRRIGFEYGHQFILARLSDVSKISLDWSVSFHYMNLDWSSSNIYRDTSESVITYRKDAVSFGFGQKLGVNYTHLFKKKFPVDFYYKYAGAFEDGGQIGKYSNSNFIFEGSGSGEVEYEGTTFFHSFGVNFRYDFYFIGLEYSFGKTNVTYSLPYIETNSHWDGTQYIYNHNIHHDSFYGESRYNSLKLTFGLMFGGGYKWKKLAVKEYKKGL